MIDKPKIFVVTRTPKGLDNILSVKPDVAASFYAAVINVSDSPCASFDYQLKLPSFWFPIHEIEPWGYTPFLAALRVVNEFYKGDKPILIHCHAGANRSPSVAFAILKAKGYTDDEAAQSLKYTDIAKVFQRNITMKLIPKNIIRFLEVAEKHQDRSMNGLMAVLHEGYLEYADGIYDTIKDFTITDSAGNPIRLVYNRDIKQFVVNN
jgi:hypothetical protein